MKKKKSMKSGIKEVKSKKPLEKQIRFLKSIVEDLVGKSAVPIIDLLVGKKHINEFLIAKKLSLTINQTRNILYKLSDFGLVSFIRKKDKRKGWYIYFWTLDIFQSLNLLEHNLREELENLENQLKNRKEKRYFTCNRCSIEVTEENALLKGFVCSECEEVYQLSDNKEIIERLEKSIDRIKKEIELVALEKEIEGGKIEKKKAVKIKKEERKIKALKAKARKIKLLKKKLEEKHKKISKIKKKAKKIRKKISKIKKKAKKRVKKKFRRKKIKKKVKKKFRKKKT